MLPSMSMAIAFASSTQSTNIGNAMVSGESFTAVAEMALCGYNRALVGHNLLRRFLYLHR